VLTERQRRFVDAYRGNGFEAARAAGYRGTKASLMVAASKLLKHPDVAAALRERQARVLASADVVDEPAIALAPKHQLFVDEYIRSGNAKGSARAAGYSARSAPGLLARADVHEVLERASARREVADIAQDRELQTLLTRFARDEKLEARARIRAIVELHRIQRGVVPAGADDSASDTQRQPPRLTIVRNGRGPESP
jgi:phage terminase small subunit